MKTSLVDAYQWTAASEGGSFLDQAFSTRCRRGVFRNVSKKSTLVSDNFHTFFRWAKKFLEIRSPENSPPLSVVSQTDNFFATADENNSRYAAIDRNTARRSFLTPTPESVAVVVKFVRTVVIGVFLLLLPGELVRKRRRPRSYSWGPSWTTRRSIAWVR